MTIDYRDDPKASTGNFEMVYRQNIPPAPSYLGLNLCLKGTPFFPKKEKVIRYDANRARNDRKRMEKKPTSNTISPKSLYFDNKENHQYYSIESLASPRKPINPSNALHKLQSNTYRSIDRFPLGIAANQAISKLAHPKHLNRYETNPTLSQFGDSSTRHKSCGPRLASIITRYDDIKPEWSMPDNESEQIECVGNGYGPDNEDLLNGNGPFDVLKTSIRKESLNGTPRNMTVQRRLLPLNTAPKTHDMAPTTPSIRPIKLKTSSTDTSKYRKYLTPKCLRSKSSISLATGIHYYGDGSSFAKGGAKLRGWRSKTGHIGPDALKIDTKQRKQSNDVSP